MKYDFNSLESEQERLEVRQLKDQIRRAKLRLKEQARKQGITENFGKDVYTTLKDKYNPVTFQNPALRGQVVILLTDFQKFCVEFDLNDL